MRGGNSGIHPRLASFSRPHMLESRRAHSVLFMGVAAFSLAAILIRLAEAPPLVVAAYRLGIASVAIVPIAILKAGGELRALPRKDVTLSLLSGLLLALHFSLWITSLSYTSVASSVVLVTTTPLFVGVASHFLLKEKASRRMVLGILLATGGGVTIAGGDLQIAGRAAFGDVLALMGAVMSSGYYLIGRVLRKKLSMLSYVALNYPSAALLLTILSLVARQGFLGYPPRTYLFLLLLALVPQLIGYSCINWALGHLSATFVTVAILGEPIGATILAALILHELPNLTEILGAALILIGIYVATQEAR